MIKSDKLYQLAKVILLIEKDGLSKVRFAKTIYFVHKELARLGVMERGELEYIRMPLGPVPNGFMRLADDHTDIKTIVKHTGLLYDALTYKMAWPSHFIAKRSNPLYLKIEEILSRLHNISTSSLVEISHKEPSWIRHKNGDVYSIALVDMTRPFPVSGGKTDVDENQRMQASLVKGMLEEIVEESTALEYPTDARK